MPGYCKKAQAIWWSTQKYVFLRHTNQKTKDNYGIRNW